MSFFLEKTALSIIIFPIIDQNMTAQNIIPQEVLKIMVWALENLVDREVLFATILR